MKIINGLKKSPCAAAVAFSLITLSLTALYWAVMLFTRSAWINSYFITDHTNTAMDYFNMLATKNSYTSDANYPAICFVFWKIMRRFIPAYDLAGLNDGFDYRENMVAQLGFIITVFVCIVIMAISVKIKIKGSDTANILLTVSLVLSGPMLFLLERGNILLIVISLTMLFCALYDHDNKYLRFISYISLAVAAAIKIYPAVFGLLLIKRRRYKDAAVLAAIGFAVFILPFFAFDGFSSLLKMFTGMTKANNENIGSGFGYNFSLTNILRITAAFLGKHIETAPSLIVYSGVLILLVGFIISKKEWQQLFFLGMICLWTPFFSYTYSLVILFPALLSFLREWDENGKPAFSGVYFALFVISLVPLALPLMNRINYNLYHTDAVRFPLSCCTVIINLALMAISGIIFVENIFKNKRRTVK